MSNETKPHKTRKLRWLTISFVIATAAVFAWRLPFNHFALLEYDWGQFSGTHCGPLFTQVETMLTDFRASSSECDISKLHIIVEEREIHLIPESDEQKIADGWVRDVDRSDQAVEFWNLESEWGECEVIMQAGEPKNLLLLIKNGPHRIRVKGFGKAKAESVVLPATPQEVVSRLGNPINQKTGILH